jgi:hypothetical protein
MKTNKTVQQYIGYMLSMSQALLWDNSAMEAPLDEKSFETAQDIVSKIFERELYKNKNRISGAEGHFDEIGVDA